MGVSLIQQTIYSSMQEIPILMLILKHFENQFSTWHRDLESFM